MTPEQLAEKLRTILADKVESIVLFGSMAVNDQTKDYSDTNVLVILKEMDFSFLKRVGPELKSWLRQGNPAPLFFSEARFSQAQDVFPIELADMKEAYRVLWGKDVIAPLKIDKSHLRRQLERELRVRLLQLQQKFLETGGNLKLIQELLGRSLSTFGVLFKSLLRLTGDAVPSKRHDVWLAVQKHVSIDAHVMETILRLRERDKEALQHDPNDLLERLIKNIKITIDFVDRFSAT